MVTGVIGLLTVLGGISMFLSWIVYVPLYLMILRRRAPDLYQGLGGMPIMRAASLRHLFRFLINKTYLSSRDQVVLRHSRIMSVTLLGGIATVLGGTLYAVLMRLAGIPIS